MEEKTAHKHDEDCEKVLITGGIAKMHGEPDAWQGRVIVSIDGEEMEFARRIGFLSKEQASAWIQKQAEEVKDDVITVLGKPDDEIKIEKWT